MALTNAFNEAVNSGNIRRIRIMMKDSLLVDPTFKEFEEMEKKVKTIKGIYDTHDGRIFEHDDKKWDDNYMDKQMVQLVSNFSDERIKHIKDIVSHLRPIEGLKSTSNKTKDNNSKTKNSHQKYEEQKRRDKEEGRLLTTVAPFTIVGAGVGAGVAFTAGSTVVIGAGVGAVAGTVVGALFIRGRS